MDRSNVIPDSKAEVSKRWLKSPNLDVEKAKQDMIAAREEATTTGLGTKVPKFIEETAKRQGVVVPVSAESIQTLAASARAKLSRAGAQPGARVDLNKARDLGIITQEEVDALLGKPMTVVVPVEEDVVEEEPVPVVESTPAPVPVPERVPVATAPVVSEPTDRRTRLEDKQCSVEIYKDGREWIAELVYKNGSGTEKFYASSKDELMAKLAIGKANATIKVRDTVRRMRLGDKPDGWDFFFKQVEESHGLTIEQYNALPDASKALIQDTVQAQQILAFTNAHPDYYATEKNFKSIADYLNNKEVPLTLHNLELAYSDLIEDDLLELRPKPAEPAPAPVAPPAPSSVPTVVPVVEDSTAVVPVAPVAPATPAPAPNATPVRKKVSTGLVPGSSSAAPSGTVTKPTEESTVPKELSVTELKKLSDAELKRIATQGRKFGRIY